MRRLMLMVFVLASFACLPGLARAQGAAEGAQRLVVFEDFMNPG
jgi:hypothetical protein